MKLETAKGVRDFPQEEKIIRDEVINKLKNIFEIYGFNPIETPILERLSTLTAKFVAGEESDVIKEVFRLKDQGGRDLGLRYELTLSLARFIGMNPTLKMPFKRYEIGRVYRDGPIKLGRYREFYQCDVDVVGIKDVVADAEIISLANDVFRELGLDVIIEISNRKLLDGILEEARIPKEKRMCCMIIIDKIKKQGEDVVVQELKKVGVDNEKINKILSLITIKGDSKSKLKILKQELKSNSAKDGIKELEELFSYLDILNIEYEFNPALARGLVYYTGPMFEVFLKDSEITPSVAGGGRWDGMISKLLGRGEYPATGISFGLEPITDAIKFRGIEKKSVTQLYVIPIKTLKDSWKIVNYLRKKGIKTDIDFLDRGISKNLEYANKMKIPYVIILGEKEIKDKKVKIKNMESGEETLVNIEEVENIVKR